MKPGLFGLPALLFSLLIACGGTPEAPPTASHLTISPQSVTVAPGASQTLTATLDPASPAGVTWSAASGHLDMAGLTAVYTAPTLPGTYTVRALSVAAPQVSAEATVTVQSSEPAGGTGITLRPGRSVLSLTGPPVQLTAVVRDGSGAPTTAAVQWTSSDPDVVRVNASGMVTPVRVGNAVVTATSGAQANGIPVAVVAFAPDTAILTDAQILQNVSVPPDLPAGQSSAVVALGAAPRTGTLLFSTGETPLAGRVVSASPEANGFRVILASAPLTDYFTDLDLKVDRPIPTTELSAAGVRPGHLTPLGSAGIHCSGTAGAAITTTLRLSGSLRFLGNTTVHLQKHLGKVQLDAHAGGQLLGQLNAALSTELSSDGTFDCQLDLGALEFPQPELLGLCGIDLPLSLAARGSVQASGTTARLQSAGSVDVQANLGLTYDSDVGFRSQWSSSLSKNLESRFVPGLSSFTATGDLTAGAQSGIGVYCGVPGVYKDRFGIESSFAGVQTSFALSDALSQAIDPVSAAHYDVTLVADAKPDGDVESAISLLLPKSAADVIKTRLLPEAAAELTLYRSPRAEDVQVKPLPFKLNDKVDWTATLAEGGALQRGGGAAAITVSRYTEHEVHAPEDLKTLQVVPAGRTDRSITGTFPATFDPGAGEHLMFYATTPLTGDLQFKLKDLPLGSCSFDPSLARGPAALSSDGQPLPFFTTRWDRCLLKFSGTYHLEERVLGGANGPVLYSIRDASYKDLTFARPTPTQKHGNEQSYYGLIKGEFLSGRIDVLPGLMSAPPPVIGTPTTVRFDLTAGSDGGLLAYIGPDNKYLMLGFYLFPDARGVAWPVEINCTPGASAYVNYHNLSCATVIAPDGLSMSITTSYEISGQLVGLNHVQTVTEQWNVNIVSAPTPPTLP